MYLGFEFCVCWLCLYDVDLRLWCLQLRLWFVLRACGVLCWLLVAVCCVVFCVSGFVGMFSGLWWSGLAVVPALLLCLCPMVSFVGGFFWICCVFWIAVTDDCWVLWLL